MEQRLAAEAEEEVAQQLRRQSHSDPAAAARRVASPTGIAAQPQLHQQFRQCVCHSTATALLAASWLSDSGRIRELPKESEGSRAQLCRDGVELVAEWQRGESGLQLQLSDGIVGETEIR